MLTLAKVGLLAVAVALPLSAQTNTAKQRRIVADASGPTTAHAAMPLLTVCAGRANEGLRADWQQQLALLQREVGFSYLRFHGLLHDDMAVYSEDGKGRPAYNFEYIDLLYDYMLSQHIRPFVELSFMPAKLASGTKTVFWWKANVSPPKDMQKWNGLIRALMHHWQARYGEGEISQWYYEVWNEPDLANFWSGTEQEYFELYKNTAETIKSECPRCRVGGPASAIKGYEDRWLNWVISQHIPADFLSTHAYGVSGILFDESGNAKVTTGDPVSRVRDTRHLIDKSAMPGLELHYTEWSSRYTPFNTIHDQYVSAAFILDRLREATGLTQSMAYWTFTDIFEEDGPRFTPFSGAFGLISRDGVRKPAFFAYKFLAQLGAEDLATNDKQSWVTKKPDGSLQVLLWDYTPGSPARGESDETRYAKEQPAQAAGPAAIHLMGLPNGRYTMKVYAVGHDQNDAYTTYLRMGSPSQLNREQLAALQSKSTGAPFETRPFEVSKDVFDYALELQQNEAVLVTVERR